MNFDVDFSLKCRDFRKDGMVLAGAGRGSSVPGTRAVPRADVTFPIEPMIWRFISSVMVALVIPAACVHPRTRPI